MKSIYRILGLGAVSAVISALPPSLVHAQAAVTHEVVGAVDTPAMYGSQDDINAWFSQAELDQMLAPVALYPDAVLSHVLLAATYPLEIVEADRWRQNNAHLDAEAALNAVQAQPWDASVKALVAFAPLLRRLSEDLQWTRDLGDAFLMSEAVVMDRVQMLRQQAWNHGELRSTEHVQVVREQQTIIIEPVVERVVYLPSYDTRVVYGDWRWAHYPPVYWQPWHPVSYHPRTTVYWGPAVHVTPAFYVSAFHWPQRHVVVVNHISHSPRPVFYSSRSIVHHHSAARWQHRPDHRRGVGYHRGYRPRDAHIHRQPPPRSRAVNTRRDDRHRSYSRSYTQAPSHSQRPSYRQSESASHTRQHRATGNRDAGTRQRPNRQQGQPPLVRQSENSKVSSHQPSGNQSSPQVTQQTGSREERIRRHAQAARDAAAAGERDRSNRRQIR